MLTSSSETIAGEQPDSFYNLLDIITNPEVVPSPASSTPQAVHEFVLNTAINEGYLSEPGALASVQLALGLHTALPRLEAYYQYYEDRLASRTDDTQCDSWVDWYGHSICDLDELSRLVHTETIEPSESMQVHGSFVPSKSATYNVCRYESKPKLLPFDRVHPDPARALVRPPHTAILYGSINSPTFRNLHTFLYKESSGLMPRLEYVFRPAPETDRERSPKKYLSGYGVALDLKKMEYLALDDRGQSECCLHDMQIEMLLITNVDAHRDASETDEPQDSSIESDPIVALLQQYPENATADYTTALSPEELLQIGLQATQLIYDSQEPLDTMKQLSQNFPKYASSIARRVTVDSKLEEVVASNQLKAQGGVNMVWLNGVIVSEKDMNPFTLLRLLRKERAVMTSLGSLGLTPGQALTLLTHNAVSQAQTDTGVLDGLFDASDRSEGGDLIVWWNDFENDARYARWGTSLQLLLRPMYPGQFPNIKKNLFNVVLSVDMSQSSTLNFLAGAVNNIINRSFPIRFGIVPIIESEDGTI